MKHSHVGVGCPLVCTRTHPLHHKNHTVYPIASPFDASHVTSVW